MKKIFAGLLVFSSIFAITGCGEAEDFGEEITYEEFKSAQEAVSKSSWGWKNMKVTPAKEIKKHAYAFKRNDNPGVWYGYIQGNEINITGTPKSGSVSGMTRINNLGEYRVTSLRGDRNMALWSELPDNASSLGADLYGENAGSYEHKFYVSEDRYTVVATSGKDKRVFQMEKEYFAFLRATLCVSGSIDYDKDEYVRFNYELTHY